MRSVLAVLLGAVVCLWAAGVRAQSAAESVRSPRALESSPEAEPVLAVTTAAGTVQFSLAQLERLGMVQVTTSTFWPSDDGTYEGPLLADVLRTAGIDASGAIRVRALDGFSQVLPREDWERWPVVLATRRDGTPLTRRRKGPLRIIYPRDMDPELHNTLYRLRWVWLVDAIEPVAAP